MTITGIDHIVLCVRSAPEACAFYERTLGLVPREERPGKWSLTCGAQKFSLQEESSLPDIARGTVRGSGNVCLLTDEEPGTLRERLEGIGVEIASSLRERDGAQGPILSFHMRDPDGNLVEIGSPVGRPVTGG